MTDAEEVRTRLHWRYATKLFDSGRAIPADVWAVLEESLVLAPSSFGLQPWKFLVVDDKELRAELRKHSWNQAQITDADKLVVFTSQRTMAAADVDRYVSRTCEVRDMAPETLAGYRNVIVGFLEKGWAARDLQGWNTRQVYLALGQFMTAAAMLGVDTCPMEGIDMAAYDRVLGLEGTPFTTAVACTAGYRAEADKYARAAKVRYDAAEVIERR
ncbi:MAG: NAD(P)H-dependent oxidoreductase [Planctomycetes bacterium]|nr:NAD(P)H-dependent oxidoreductase [Planctomycetota bacterium]MCB9883999.1 NAD(P)H-dependent oxidoreductase [Planctomycetota bacterium]